MGPTNLSSASRNRKTLVSKVALGPFFAPGGIRILRQLWFFGHRVSRWLTPSTASQVLTGRAADWNRAASTALRFFYLTPLGYKLGVESYF